MSRKDYRTVALRVRQSIEHFPDSAEALSLTARLMADDFKIENPSFRYDVFYAACGLDEWGEAIPNATS